MALNMNGALEAALSIAEDVMHRAIIHGAAWSWPVTDGAKSVVEPCRGR